MNLSQPHQLKFFSYAKNKKIPIKGFLKRVCVNKHYFDLIIIRYMNDYIICEFYSGAILISGSKHYTSPIDALVGAKDSISKNLFQIKTLLNDHLKEYGGCNF